MGLIISWFTPFTGAPPEYEIYQRHYFMANSDQIGQSETKSNSHYTKILIVAIFRTQNRFFTFRPKKGVRQGDDFPLSSIFYFRWPILIDNLIYIVNMAFLLSLHAFCRSRTLRRFSFSYSINIKAKS